MGWGKIIGLLMGFLIGGWFFPFLGLLIGHAVDLIRNNRFLRQATETRRLLFEMTFKVMGHIAKSDGRVTQNALDAARNIMQQMHLSTAQREQAMHLFNAGKDPSFHLDNALNELVRISHGNFILLQIFFDLQMKAAQLSGPISIEKQTKLDQILARIGGNAFTSSFYSHFSFGGRQQYHHSGFDQTGSPHISSLKEDYALLGISESASPEDIKKAYRRLMNQHHPDKLTAKGLPEEMLRLATEKTQAIQTAYERIKKARGF